MERISEVGRGLRLPRTAWGRWTEQAFAQRLQSPDFCMFTGTDHHLRKTAGSIRVVGVPREPADEVTRNEPHILGWT